MATSDFDQSRANVFKTDISFNVKYDEVDGVKKNPRFSSLDFTLGGLDLRLDAKQDKSSKDARVFALKAEVLGSSLRSLEDGWMIGCQVFFRQSRKKYSVNLHSGARARHVTTILSDCYNLSIILDFKYTTPYRLPFVDEEAAKKNRADCKIILENDTTKPIYVNKAVLASHSDFFNTMFFGDFQEKDQEEVKLSDVMEADFLQYLFCVQPPIKPFLFKNLEAPLRLADRFQNDVLLSSIEKFLYKNTKSSDEKRQTLIWAERYHMSSLFDDTLEKMEKTDFKGLDCSVTSQFQQPYMKLFHKHMCTLLCPSSSSDEESD